MPDNLVVIVPSRGRPVNIYRLIQAFKTTGATARLVVNVDNDDPVLSHYQQKMAADLGDQFALVAGPRMRLVPTLNREAVFRSGLPDIKFVGFMGDDHLPKTVGWDRQIADQLERPGVGIVYGNDLIQGPNLPTAVFMRASIVRALGYFAPPKQLHLFADNAWLRWGQEASCLAYLPHVVIEHLHPIAQRASWDAGYAEVNALWAQDEAAWLDYEQKTLKADVAKIKKVMA